MLENSMKAPISAPSPRSQNKLTISSYQNPFFRSKSNSFPGSPRRALRASVDHSKARSERPSTSSPQHRRAALKGSGCVWFLDQRHRLLHIYIYMYMYYRCSSVFMSGIIVYIYIYTISTSLWLNAQEALHWIFSAVKRNVLLPEVAFRQTIKQQPCMDQSQSWHCLKIRSAMWKIWSRSTSAENFSAEVGGIWSHTEKIPDLISGTTYRLVGCWEITPVFCAQLPPRLYDFCRQNFHWRNIRPCFS